MFRIIFDTKVAKWIIQIKVFMFFWSTIKAEDENREFINFNAAIEWINEVGLCSVYRYRNDTMSYTIFNGVVVCKPTEFKPDVSHNGVITNSSPEIQENVTELKSDSIKPVHRLKF